MNLSKTEFPLRLYILVFALSIFTALIGGALTWQMFLNGDEMAKKHVALTQNIGRIMLLDEVLTMSARMAVASGDMSYERRYDQFYPQLTTAINTIRTVLPQTNIAKFVGKTDAANNALVKMERQAFALIHQGKRQEAMALLASDDYVRLKAVYADGMVQAARAADNLTEHEDRQLHRLAFGMLMLVIIVAAILLATWFFALRAARLWEEERKQAILILESANQQATQQVSLLLETLPLILYTCQAEGDFGTIYISSNVERVTGYPAELLTEDATFWTRHLHPDDRKHVDDQLAELFKQPSLSHEYRWQVADGSYRWFLDVSYLARHADGVPSHIVGVWLDISERKAAEEQLFDSAARIHTIFDAVADGILTIDEHGIVETLNPAAERIFGYAAAEVVGRNINMLMPEPYHSEHDGYLEHYRATGEARIIGIEREVIGRRKDGGTFPLELAVSKMRLGEGRFFIGIVRDITARKQNELALAAAQQELQTAYASILHKNTQLQESNRARSEFLATMSHELRTPLNVIIGFSELFKEGLAGPLTEEQRVYTQNIFDSGIKLLALLTGIIDYSFLEAGHTQLKLQALKVDAWLTECVMPWRERAAAGGLTFKLDIPEPLGTTWLDAAKARQILVNLLSNAVKFTKAGGTMTLTARRVKQKAVTVNILPDTYSEYLELEVRDTGIGFPSELLSRLFEPFHQGDATLARQYEGIGLGLAMVKSLVDIHNGSVQADNAPKQGACVTVWLPWRKDAADQQVEPLAPE